MRSMPYEEPVSGMLRMPPCCIPTRTALVNWLAVP
jgi:hypothetical protein